MNYSGLVPISVGVSENYAPSVFAGVWGRALRMLDTATETSEVSEFEAIKSVASKLGTPEESVRAPESAERN